MVFDIYTVSGIVLLLHFFADFNLQIGAGLDKFKQKRWWDEQIKEHKPLIPEVYDNDYKVALLCHSLYWALLVSLPFAIAGHGGMWLATSAYQSFCHYGIDNAKANHMTFNLVEDQILHIVQLSVIVLSYALVFH